MLALIILHVAMLSKVMLTDFTLCAVVQNVIMPSASTLKVVAPFFLRKKIIFIRGKNF